MAVNDNTSDDNVVTPYNLKVPAKNKGVAPDRFTVKVEMKDTKFPSTFHLFVCTRLIANIQETNGKCPAFLLDSFMLPKKQAVLTSAVSPQTSPSPTAQQPHLDVATVAQPIP